MHDDTALRRLIPLALAAGLLYVTSLAFTRADLSAANSLRALKVFEMRLILVIVVGM